MMRLPKRVSQKQAFNFALNIIHWKMNNPSAPEGQDPASMPPAEDHAAEGQVVAGQEGADPIGKTVSMAGLPRMDPYVPFNAVGGTYKVDAASEIAIGDLYITVRVASDAWFDQHSLVGNGVVVAHKGKDGQIEFTIVIRASAKGQALQEALAHEFLAALAVAGAFSTDQELGGIHNWIEDLTKAGINVPTSELTGAQKNSIQASLSRGEAVVVATERRPAEAGAVVSALDQYFSAIARPDMVVQFEIDPFSLSVVDGSLKNRLVEVTKSSQIIRLSLKNLSSDARRFDKAMSVVNFLEKVLSQELSASFNVTSFDLKSAVRELLMNAILHGNRLDPSLPIYIVIDSSNKRIEVYDSAELESHGQAWEQMKEEAERAGIGGEGSGLNLLRGQGWRHELTSVAVGDSGRRIGKAVVYKGAKGGNAEPGGIDFRAFPIVTQAVSNLRAPISADSLGAFQRMNLSEEWNQIEQMVSSGITPSAERIKEFIQASCAQGSSERDIKKVISCISDILLQEEMQTLIPFSISR
jgi:anti-sigma regulatory factor (Ser/Thr protein kinase)